MNKLKLVLLFFVMSTLCVSAQKNYYSNQNGNFFKGLFFQQNHAIYGFNFGTTPVKPKLFAVFYRDKFTTKESYTLKQYKWINCIDAYITLHLTRDVVILDVKKTKWNNQIVSLVPTLNGIRPLYTDQTARDINSSVDLIPAQEFNSDDMMQMTPVLEVDKSYTMDELLDNGQIFDHFKTTYGRRAVQPLSQNLFDEYNDYLGNREKTFSDFLLESKADVFQKAVMLQNHADLFLPKDQLEQVGIQLDDSKIWKQPVYCDTINLKKYAFYALFPNNCQFNTWDEIYTCIYKSDSQTKKFNDYVKSLYPQWVNYKKNCVEDKFTYEKNECECMRYITIYGGKMSTLVHTNQNKSSDGILPDNASLLYGGGTDRGWLPPRAMGYNQWENIYRWGGDPDLKIIEHGNDQGLSGWHMYELYGDGCTPEYTNSYSIGSSANPIKYYETYITYGCRDKQSDLVSDCACPIAVGGVVKYQTNMTASSKATGGCWTFGSHYSGNVEEAGAAYLLIANQLKATRNLTILDAGVGKAYTESNQSTNKDFFYKAADFAAATAKAYFGISNGGISAGSIDSSVLPAIRAGIDLAFTKPMYESSINSTNFFRAVDKDFNFLLGPNEMATVRLSSASKYDQHAENYGEVRLNTNKSFLVSFYGDAAETNLCCNPAFMTWGQSGFSADRNAIFNTNIMPYRGNNQSQIDYSSGNENGYWGEEQFDFTCEHVRIHYGKTIQANSKKPLEDVKPTIDYAFNSIRFYHMEKGDYDIKVYNLQGQTLYSDKIYIENPQGDITFDNLPNGTLIFKLSNANIQLTKTVNYEK